MKNVARDVLERGPQHPISVHLKLFFGRKKTEGIVNRMFEHVQIIAKGFELAFSPVELDFCRASSSPFAR